MTILRIRATGPEDAAYIVDRLNPEDRQILEAQAPRTVLEGVESSIASSTPHAYTITIISGAFESPAGLLGVRPVHRGTGIDGEVWFVPTDALRRPDVWRAFSKESKRWVKAMSDKWLRLFTLEDERSDLHIKWLKFCGFRILGRQWWSPEETEWNSSEGFVNGIPYLLMVK